VREGYDYVSVGNYVPKSKYQSVNEAVKWSVGLIQYFNPGENKEIFAKKLEANLVSEIDKKVKENSGLGKRIENFLAPDLRFYAHKVDLKSIIQKTLVELGFPKLPDYAVFPDSVVSPDIFVGRAPLRDYENTRYNFGRHNIDIAAPNNFVQQNKANNTRSNNHVQIQ
jgi:hypothetical protein